MSDFPDLELEATERGYLIMGPVGSGKTHLAAAMFRRYTSGRLIVTPVLEVDGLNEPALVPTRRTRERVGIFGSAHNWLRAFKAEFDDEEIDEMPAPEEDYNPAVYFPPKKLGVRARTAEIVVIDDYGASEGTDWSRQELLGIIDDRMNKKAFTIVTTNLPMNKLRDSNERLFDRLRFLKVVKLTGPSLRKSG